MTRLEPAGEPSMEEILASIRRIIAEDPPGSRPAESAAPAAPASRARDTARDAARDTAVVPRFEPQFDAEDIADRDFAGFDGPAAASRLEEPAAPARQQPSFGLPPFAAREAASTASAPASRPAPFDIDAQLADVLGAVRAPAATPQPSQTSAAQPVPSTAVSVQAAIDSLTAPRQEPVARAAPRPGFTVSRDGYIPEPPADTAAPPAPAADPFEFTLGPSPFARTDAMPAADAGPRSAAARDLGAIIPAKHRLGDNVAAGTGTSEASASATLAIEPEAPRAAAPDAVRAQPQPDFGRLSLSPDQNTTAAPVAPPKTAVTGYVIEEPVAVSVPQAVREAASAFVAAPSPAPLTQEAAAPVAAIKSPDLVSDRAPEMLSTASPATPAAAAPASAEAAIAVLERIANPRAEVQEPGVASAASIAAETSQTASTQQSEPVAGTPPAQQTITQEPVAGAPADAAPAVAEPAAPAVAAEPIAPIVSAPQTALEAVMTRAPEPAAHDEPEAPVAASAAMQTPAEIVIEDEKPEIESAPAQSTASGAPAPDAPTSPAPAASAVALRDAHTLHATDNEPASHAMATARTMEDTVAELLRPMLKNWLAENMPKIVERALRKELDDRNRSEHKTAAE